MMPKSAGLNTSMVYFARTPRGIKIGCAKNVPARICAVRLEEKTRDVVLIGSFPGTFETERWLHSKFAFERVAGDGEMFEPSRRLLSFVRSVGVFDVPSRLYFPKKAKAA